MSIFHEQLEAEQALAAACYGLGQLLLTQSASASEIKAAKDEHFLKLDALLKTSKWQRLKVGFSLSDQAISLLAIVYLFQREPDLVSSFAQLSWYDQRGGISAKRALELAIHSASQIDLIDYPSLLSREANIVQSHLLICHEVSAPLIQTLSLSDTLFYWLTSVSQTESVLDRATLNGGWLTRIQDSASPATLVAYQGEFHKPSPFLNIIKMDDERESLAFIHSLVLEIKQNTANLDHLWLLQTPITGADSILSLQSKILAMQLQSLPNGLAIYWPTLLDDSVLSNEIRLLLDVLINSPKVLLFCQPYSAQSQEHEPLWIKELEKHDSVFYEPQTSTEQCAMAWLELCKAGGLQDALNHEDASQLAERYPLASWQMMNASNSALAEVREGQSAYASIQYACLQNMASESDGLASFSLPKVTLADMVLNNESKDQLQEIMARMQFKSLLKQQVPNFLAGTQALFWGAPGTGKTMAAEAIAGELNLPLYKVNLSNVASKWIGETEKHLSKLFDQAEKQQAVLLFDEADAIFAKRSEVESSQDKNANMGVSYLLQRMESYQGILLLSTNFKANIDDAFLRRFTTVTEFMLPDKQTRKTLWQRVWQGDMQLDTDVNLDSLAAEFELSPSQIRNVGERACLLAAMKSTNTISKTLLAKALRREFDKQSAGFVTAKRLTDWINVHA